MNDEKKVELKMILNQINGIFDFAYENTVDEEEKQYICDTEEALLNFLKEAGLLDD